MPFPLFVALAGRYLAVGFLAAAFVKEPELTLDVVLAVEAPGGLISKGARLAKGQARVRAVTQVAYDVVDIVDKVRTPRSVGAKAAGSKAEGMFVVDNRNDNNDISRGRFHLHSGWLVGSDYGDKFIGSGYRYAHASRCTGAAEFSFRLDNASDVRINAWWTTSSDRADAVPFVVVDPGGREVTRFFADQTKNGEKWVPLGHVKLPAGLNKVLVSCDVAEGKVAIADAILIQHSARQ